MKGGLGRPFSFRRAGIRIDLPTSEAAAGAIETSRSPNLVDGKRMVAERRSPRLGAHTRQALADPACGG